MQSHTHACNIKRSCRAGSSIDKLSRLIQHDKFIWKSDCAAAAKSGLRVEAPPFLPLEADTPVSKKHPRDTAAPTSKPPGPIKQEPPTASKRTADSTAKRAATEATRAIAKRPTDNAPAKHRAAPEAAVAVKKEGQADQQPACSANKRPREEAAADAGKAAGKVPDQAAVDADAHSEPKRRKV